MPECITSKPPAAEVPEFGYKDTGGGCTIPVLGPTVERLIPAPAEGARALDVGCGNGFWAGRLAAQGYETVGIDPSAEGVRLGSQTYPNVRFVQTVVSRSILDELAELPFDLVLSLEVVEHLYDPRSWAAGCFAALKPGGLLICSTPYHGYLKNLVMAVTNKLDAHFTALWDGGHIKFWSRKTLYELLREAGFTNPTFNGAGRFPYLWKAMVITARKPR